MDDVVHALNKYKQPSKLVQRTRGLFYLASNALDCGRKIRRKSICEVFLLEVNSR
jgi:hypothetical protein